jgi:Clr5 domain
MREPFRKCYIDQDMSLRDATNHLATIHDFPASERQWERKKEQWGFTKYQKRETRQQFIDEATRRGMTMEDILNAPDIPAEGSGGDDRAVRRNWRRFVKREHANRSRSGSRQPHSPEEGQSRPFDAPSIGPNHNLVEKTYDVEIPNDIAPDRTTGALPDAIMLEATSADGTGQSPIQLHIVSEANASTDIIPAPDIYISTWDDSERQFQDLGQYQGATYTNYADTPYQSENNMLTAANSNTTGGINEHFESFQDYQQAQDPSNFPQRPNYESQGSNSWSDVRDLNVAGNSDEQAFFEQARDAPIVSDTFPPIDQVPQLHFDQSFDEAPEVAPAATPRTPSRASNDYFQSFAADPLTTDLSNMVDEYTNDIQTVVKTFLDGFLKVSHKVTQEKLDESLQMRRDICLRALSTAIEDQARTRQRVLDSITEKCQNLERIMNEKGIDTRAELRQLKARSNPRQPTDNSALDMSQFSAAVPANYYTGAST